MRKFIDIEREITITLDDVMKAYEDDLKNDFETYADISFNQYLNNSLAINNGTLREIKTISAEQAKKIEEDTKNLICAFLQFNLTMNIVTESSFNSLLCEDYPFSESFDESFYTTLSWLENVKNHAKNRDFETIN